VGFARNENTGRLKMEQARHLEYVWQMHPPHLPVSIGVWLDIVAIWTKHVDPVFGTRICDVRARNH